MRMSLFVRCAGVSVALFVASLISFPSLPNPAAGWFTLHPAVTVNRALKGDRLPLADPIADRSRELGLPVSPAPSQAPRKSPPWVRLRLQSDFLALAGERLPPLHGLTIIWIPTRMQVGRRS